jgi:hypothetical protein
MEKQKSFVPKLFDRRTQWALRPYRKMDVAATLQASMEQAYDLHFKRNDVTTNRCSDRGNTNPCRPENSEFYCRHISHIRGRDGVMAAPYV